MLIIPQKVEVNLTNNVKYYESIGYEIPRYKDKQGRLSIPKGTKISIDIEHLSKNSHIMVLFKCDYCGKTYSKEFRHKSKLDDIINKDCCNDCKQLKIVESNMTKYNRSYSGDTPEAHEITAKKHRTGFDKLKKEFENVNFTLLIKEDEYKNSKQRLACVCKNHPNIVQYKSRNSVTKGCGCKICDHERKTKDGHPNYKGGITPLHNYLRRLILSWKIDSRKFCNNKCVITGKKSGIIHHLFGFTMILQELIDDLQLNIDFTKTKVEDLPEKQLRQIEEKCLELHYKHGLGVCLSKDIHKLYHSIYGYGQNTPEQFQKFKQRYDSGEFSSLSSAK